MLLPVSAVGPEGLLGYQHLGSAEAGTDPLESIRPRLGLK